jgi:hypothetical protein
MSFLMNSKIYALEIDVWREASANPQSETGTLATHSGKKQMNIIKTWVPVNVL